MLFNIQKRLKWKRLHQRRHINKCQNEFDELQETNEKVQDNIVSILCFEQIVKKNSEKMKAKTKGAENEGGIASNVTRKAMKEILVLCKKHSFYS